MLCYVEIMVNVDLESSLFDEIYYSKAIRDKAGKLIVRKHVQCNE
jgi:hypothetical protein